MTFSRNYENQLMEYFEGFKATTKLTVLNLGGSSGAGGGSGGPPGSIIGQLVQSKITYDTTESGTMYTPPSGRSLVDNLNHIRARITVLENSSILESGTETLVSGEITVLTSNVETDSIILLSHQSLGTISRPVGLGISARVNGVSFTIMSEDATDTSTVGWAILN